MTVYTANGRIYGHWKYTLCDFCVNAFLRKGSLNKHKISVHESNVTVIIAPRTFRTK